MISDTGDGCPANLQGVPLNCWNTAEVNDIRTAFFKYVCIPYVSKYSIKIKA